MIIGRKTLPAMAAFDDVQQALADWPEIVLGAHAAALTGEKIPEGSIIYNMEPLYDGCRSFSIGYQDILRAYPVLDYQQKNVEYLRTLGVDAVHMPYGFHEGLRRASRAVKDIDVLFFGSVNPRREPVLEALAQSGMNAHVVQGLYGAELDALVARAKIHVNIHYCESHPLEVVRLNYLMANGEFVISERGWDAEDNARYAHGLVFSAYEDIVENCQRFLKLEATYLRTEIASIGAEIVRGMPQGAYIEQARRKLGVYA